MIFFTKSLIKNLLVIFKWKFAFLFIVASDENFSILMVFAVIKK